jgi:hypothetical protein
VLSINGAGAPDSLNLYLDTRVDGTAGEKCKLRLSTKNADEVNDGYVFFEADGPDLCDNKFHQVTVVGGQGSLTDSVLGTAGLALFVDGMLVFYSPYYWTSGDTLSANTITIGARSDFSSSRMFSGNIKDLRVHDVALTPVEILEECTSTADAGVARPSDATCAHTAGSEYDVGRGVFTIKFSGVLSSDAGSYSVQDLLSTAQSYMSSGCVSTGTAYVNLPVNGCYKVVLGGPVNMGGMAKTWTVANGLFEGSLPGSVELISTMVGGDTVCEASMAMSGGAGVTTGASACDVAVSSEADLLGAINPMSGGGGDNNGGSNDELTCVVPKLGGSCGSGVLSGETLSIAVTGSVTVSSRLYIDGDDVSADGIVIFGEDGWETVLSGGGSVGILYIKDGADVTIRDIALANGVAEDEHGGALKVIGLYTSVLCENVLFVNNGAVVGEYDLATGGAVYVNSFADLTLVGCEFRGNYAEVGGGLGTMAGGVIKVEGCLFEENESTKKYGGAIALEATGAFEMVNSTVRDNYAPRGGAGLYVTGDQNVLIRRSNFTKNEVGTVSDFVGNGGAIRGLAGERNEGTAAKVVRVEECFFGENSAAGNGGAVYLSGIWAEFVDSKFSRNVAGSEGGAMYLYGMSDSRAEVEVTGTLFEGNRADFFDGEGTAVYSRFFVHTTLADCEFRNNRPHEGFEGDADHPFGIAVVQLAFRHSKGGLGDSAPWHDKGSAITLMNCGFEGNDGVVLLADGPALVLDVEVDQCERDVCWVSVADGEGGEHAILGTLVHEGALLGCQAFTPDYRYISGEVEAEWAQVGQEYSGLGGMCGDSGCCKDGADVQWGLGVSCACATDAPTGAPTGSPTGGPTGSPTVQVTRAPTEAPTGAPTEGITEAPTVEVEVEVTFTEAPTTGGDDDVMIYVGGGGERARGAGVSVAVWCLCICSVAAALALV